MPDTSRSQLSLTGERTLPGLAAENYWFRRHEAAYRHLADQLAGDVLLELGAGEGYGAALLAEHFTLTCALDYDVATLSHLSARYPNVAACRANLVALPFTGGCADAVVSLQVIEHIWQPGQFLDECRRVLRAGGTLALSTPNRLTFSPGLGRQQKPVNPFHSREFDADELVELIRGHGFEVTAIRGLHAGPRLRDLDGRHQGLVRAQLARPVADWSARLTADVASVEVGDFRIDGERVEDSLDLVVLAQPA